MDKIYDLKFAFTVDSGLWYYIRCREIMIQEQLEENKRKIEERIENADTFMIMSST